MINLKARIVQMPPPVTRFMKYFNNGVAIGLTKTAQEGQTAVVEALDKSKGGAFILRNKWFEKHMRHGIKITPAKGENLRSEVKTAADWLVPHETGKDKTAMGGGTVAVPTEAVRRNKRLIIPRGQRPKGLGAKAFKLMTKGGPVLAQRISRGKRKGLIILYGLEKRVRIKKQDVFRKPIENVVRRRLRSNVNEGIRRQLALLATRS